MKTGQAHLQPVDHLCIEHENEKQKLGFPVSCTDASLLSEADSP
jgi:hypothetical protein